MSGAPRVVLGVDPGTKSAAVAVMAAADDSPGLARSRVVRAWKLTAATGLELRAVFDEMDLLWRAGDEVVVCIEDNGIIRHPSVECKCKVMGTATAGLGRKVGAWVAFAEARDWDVVKVNSRSWQSRMVFPGRQPKHDVMAAASVALAKTIDPAIEWTEDLASALHIGRYVLEGAAAEKAAEDDEEPKRKRAGGLKRIR